MSMTRNELLSRQGHATARFNDFPINPTIDPRWHNEILGRLRAWLRTRDQYSLWGVCGGLYVTEGGYYDHDSEPIRRIHQPERCFPIEHILNVRPTPATTHSHWEINQ